MKTEEDMILSDEVELPYKRRELVISLKALSDRDYQYAIWVRKEFPSERFYDDMESTLNILYDDSDLNEDTASYIGTILKNEKEALAIDSVVDALSLLFKRNKPELVDKDYIEMEEWQAVLATAKAAYELIRERNSSAKLSREDEVKS